MKRFICLALLVCTVLSLFACTPAKQNGEDESTAAETTIPVTNPDGFEDVPVPPEETTSTDETTAAAKDDTTAEETTAREDGLPTIEDAMEMAKNYLGETDKETGYKYAFSYDGIQKDNEKKFHRVRVSWFIEEQERYSLCGFLLIDADGNVTKYSW